MNIDKIRNIGLDKLITQVYDFDSLTTDELLCKFAQKINIMIEHLKYVDDRCYNSDKAMEEKLQYLLGQGLEEKVAKRLLELIDNGTMEKLINQTVLKGINDKVDNIATREYISLDTFGDTQEAYQQCFDYCNENGLGILIPNKSFLINEPIILKDQGTYYIKGCNTNMNDGSRVKSKSVLIPETILFKGELIDNNTTVYLTLENVRIMPETTNSYVKDGTYVFYNLNMFGLTLNNVTCRYIDVFSQGYISKASVINNTRVSFVKTALFRGNEFNGAFMADSQITNCYFTGAYPCTFFNGTAVNSTVSNTFFDFFKHMQSLPTGTKCDGLKFKDCTIGMFYRWFKENNCNGHIEILDNKIEACSKTEIDKWKSTNFVVIDSEMEIGTYGVFYGTSWQENINGYNTKCKVYNNRFVSCDNVFTKSNSIAQVDIKNNTMDNITDIAYELSYRKDSLGENASFYCDALDNMIVNDLPAISSSGEYFVFNGQRCFLNNREYVLIDYKWVEVANNNVYSTSVTPTYTGTYNGKPLYRRLISGSIIVESTGFKTPINLPEAELLFVDLTHSYWNINGETTKFNFNANIKSAVIDKTINLLAYNSNKVLMYQQEGATTELNIDYVIAIEYTLT